MKKEIENIKAHSKYKRKDITGEERRPRKYTTVDEWPRGELARLLPALSDTVTLAYWRKIIANRETYNLNLLQHTDLVYLNSQI